MDEGYIPPVFENWNGFDLLDKLQRPYLSPGRQL